jgi:FAD/FMN-containing dehydrogenase
LFFNRYIYSGHKPDVVVYAQSTEHVSDIVKYCASKRIPVIPFGTGTGLEGTTNLRSDLNYYFFLL